MTETMTPEQRNAQVLGDRFRHAVDGCKTTADYEALVEEFAGKSNLTKEWWRALGFHQARARIEEAKST